MLIWMREGQNCELLYEDNKRVEKVIRRKLKVKWIPKVEV